MGFLNERLVISTSKPDSLATMATVFQIVNEESKMSWLALLLKNRQLRHSQAYSHAQSQSTGAVQGEWPQLTPSRESGI